MNEAILEIKEAHVFYGAVHALKGISLSVQKGEIVTLLGANGAGKSTLLRSILQMVPLHSGEITFFGKTLRKLKTHEVVKSGIALVPEGRGILGTLTVQENLELGAYYQEDWQEEREIVFSLFPRLKERWKQCAGTLSGGEQQMLALGRALVSKPKLLLLDEPSLGLAPNLIQEIFRLIKRIQKEHGVSILLVEQNAHMAMKVADRAYVLETGEIKLSGKAADLLDDEALKKAYLGG